MVDETYLTKFLGSMMSSMNADSFVSTAYYYDIRTFRC
jgi:hypothetical protein